MEINRDMPELAGWTWGPGDPADEAMWETYGVSVEIDAEAILAFLSASGD